MALASGNGAEASFLQRKLAGLWRLARDPAYRWVKLLAWFGRAGMFQPFSVTWEDRYPQIFEHVREALGERQDLRLLSFGCATGEEVFTLRRYFPAARIKGIDINSAAVATARERLAAAPEPRIEFVEGSSVADEAPGTYDAIFCMAVLRDGRLGSAPPRCDPRLRFADFERTSADLARALKPGGLLALRHSNFRFCDTSAARDFETGLAVPFPADARSTPIYGPDNRLVPGAVYLDCVFVKRGAF